jgi:hypothetical protein
MPAKRSVRSNTTKAAKPVSVKTPGGFNSIGAGAIALVAICLVTAAIVMAMRDGSDPAQIAAVDTQAAVVANTTPEHTPVASKVRPAATPAAAAANATTSDATAAAPTPSASLSATVTVAGCLERADNGFRLKDTSGEDAPKSRSWKSGFFKKSSARLALSDPTNAAHLARHLGQRVSVTGTLIDRAMVVHSLRSVAVSCK